jgi:hypothetical protein
MRAPPDAQNTTTPGGGARARSNTRVDLLADDRAHRAAHELEHEEAELGPDPTDVGGAGPVGVAGADLLGRGLDLVAVLLAVDPEAEPVGALEPEVVLLPGAGIDGGVDPRLGRQPEVVAAAATHPQVGVEVGLVQGLATALALVPKPLGD